MHRKIELMDQVIEEGDSVYGLTGISYEIQFQEFRHPSPSFA